MLPCFRSALLAASIGLATAQPGAANPPTVVVEPSAFPGQPVWDGTAVRRMLLLDGTTPRAILLEIARGNRVPPHEHSFPDVAVIVVVRGPVHYADGARFDDAGLQAYPAGSILLVPRGNMHFLTARDNDVLLLAMSADRAWLPAGLAARLPAR